MGSRSRWGGPIAVIAAAGAVLVLVYLGTADGPAGRVPSLAGPSNPDIGPTAGAGGLQPGRSLYCVQCASCHGAGGRGDGWRAWLFRLTMRDLTDAGYLQGLSDEYLFQIIKQGGATLGKPGMPSWGQHLTDSEIRELVRYLRCLARSPAQGPSAGSSPPCFSLDRPGPLC